MEFGVLIGVSTPWNGNSKSQGPEGWALCVGGAAIKTGPPALVPLTIGISRGCSWSLAPQSSSPYSAYSRMAFGLPRHRPCLLVGAVSQDNRPFGAH